MINQFIITSFKSVGLFMLNVSRTENRKNYPIQPNEFFKTESSTIPWDAYDDLGIHVEYNDNYICDAIEINNKANPIFEGIEVLKIPFSSLIQQIKSFDKNIEEDEIGFVSYKLGFGIYAPEKNDFPDNPSEGVIVFNKNYYGN